MPTLTTTKKERRKKKKDAGRPDLLERVLASGFTRLAVISLHAGSGAQTVIETLAEQALGRGVGVGVARVPRDRANGEVHEFLDTALPEGTLVATSAAVADETDALQVLEPLETTGTALRVCRVARSGEVVAHSPDDDAGLAAVLGKLEALGAQLVMVDGAWERRGFASPASVHGVVLAVGCGYSASPERSAAAVRYAVDLLSLTACEVPVAGAWREAALRGAPLALDHNGRAFEQLPPADALAAKALRAMDVTPKIVMLPGFLSDALLVPLVTSKPRFEIVVRDATRVAASPVYYTAWLKSGGRVSVVEPTRLLAVTTNPTHTAGPDADAREFRELVSAAVPDVAVHDVRLEAASDRPAWKFWG